MAQKNEHSRDYRLVSSKYICGPAVNIYGRLRSKDLKCSEDNRGLDLLEP